MKVLVFIIFPLSLTAQHSFDDYQKELKKLDFIQEYFDLYQNFSDSNYIEFLKYSINDSIGFSSDTLLGSIHSGYALFSREDNEILNYIGLWTWKNRQGIITQYTFYDLDGDAKGPNWWFRSDGSIKEKRFWNQTPFSKTTRDGKFIIMKEYYTIKYRKSGTIKYEGNYILGEKSGLWKYYNKKGDIKKEKTY